MSDNPDLYRLSFSQRHGHKKIPEPVRPGEISEKARKQLWNKLYKAVPMVEERVDYNSSFEAVGDPWLSILEYLHDKSFEFTVDEFSFFYSDFLRDYKSLICGSENALPPGDLLDLIERIISHPMCPPEFVNAVAETFEECRLPYGVNRTPPASIYEAEDEATRKLVLEPALAVLAEPRFEVAGEEFRSAMNDYRNGDYADCLANCGSSFESVLKVICKSNGWSFNKTATAGRLIKTVVEKSSLDSFFREPLSLIATMRNHLSNAHGGGDKPRAPRRSIARYAVASTAAAIVLLVSESGILESGAQPDDS